MADVSTGTPVFSRGTTVLAYWLAHAEGLTVQPSGARVEEVVATPPEGRPKTLIVRSRMMRRRLEIPAESIAAVEPSLGHLLLDPPPEGSAPRIPRPSAKQLEAARAGAARGGRVAQAQAANAARFTEAGSRSAITWLRPRALQAGAATARQTRVGAARVALGIGWLAPRVVVASRAAGATVARFVLATAVLVARGAGAATDRGRATLEARRARQQRRLDD
jgi:hypothetical protein